ncbi:MAG TPA: alpha/beta hydrolase, partial [Planctomycetaceae bacterium]|nr:alpha/beta hydrolase [Planctomycetaceae bacterium]
IDFWGHSLPARIRDERHWISLSLPGHYPSRLPPAFAADDVTTEMFAAVHAGAIRQLVGDRKVALVGWSTGGFSALNLAARHPERIASVMSICGFAKGAWWGVIGRMQRLVSVGKIGRRIFHAIWTQLGRNRWLFDLSIGLAAANRRAFRSSPVTRPTLDGWRHAVRHHELAGLATLFERLADLDIRPLLSSIAVPTLIVGGDRDPYIPLDHTRSLAAAIPGAELRIIPRTGHMFFAESTAAYHELLIDWLTRTTEPPPSPVTGSAPIGALA